MKDQRNAIDFGKMNIPELFISLFVPTLLGMLAGSLLNLADGIFVGRGVGSDALAAVNVAAPVFMISTGISLMLGSGASVVAAIHLGKGDVKAADINITQAFTVALAVIIPVVALIVAFPDTVCRLFGGSDRLAPYVKDYLTYASVSIVMTSILLIGIFIIRLDGSPKFGMAANIIGAALNIFLDWLMVFPLGMGVKGAALASSISTLIGSGMVIWYFCGHTKRLSLYKPKFSRTAIMLTMRNCWYMVKLGFSTFVSETAISCMMIAGNFMFMSRLHEDGVAAYGIACYLFPLILMFGNAIAQSALPIISYNKGIGDSQRIRKTIRLCLTVAFVTGTLMSAAGMIFCPQVVSLFQDKSMASYRIAVDGFPYMSTAFLFFTLNIVIIGCYQSLERYKPATVFMVLRGYVLMTASFIILPNLIGDIGQWHAVPLSEVTTFVLICVYEAAAAKKNRRALS
jgi:putative MATE family efflux protein